MLSVNIIALHKKIKLCNLHLVYRPSVYTSRLKQFPSVLSMAGLLILALTVFTFQNNTKIAIYMHLLEIFALLLVFFLSIYSKLFITTTTFTRWRNFKTTDIAFCISLPD